MTLFQLLDMLEENHDKLDLLHFPVAMRRLNQLRRQQKTPDLMNGFVQDIAEDSGFQVC